MTNKTAKGFLLAGVTAITFAACTNSGNTAETQSTAPAVTTATGDDTVSENAFERGVWLEAHSDGSAPKLWYFDGSGQGAWRYQSSSGDDIDHEFTYTRDGDTLALEWDSGYYQSSLDKLLFGADKYHAAVKLVEPGVVEYDYESKGNPICFTFIEDTDPDSLEYYNSAQLEDLASAFYAKHSEAKRSPSSVQSQPDGGTVIKIQLYCVYDGDSSGAPFGEEMYYIDFFTAKGHDENGNEIDLLEDGKAQMPDDPEEILQKNGKMTVGGNIPADDITDFYYTVSNINYDAFYQRYRFYTDDGKHLFFHETRERKDDYGPATEEDTTMIGIIELSDEQWAEFYKNICTGIVKAREETADAGGSGPWMYLYWNGDKSKYQEYYFASYDARLKFVEFCVSLIPDPAQ